MSDCRTGKTTQFQKSTRTSITGCSNMTSCPQICFGWSQLLHHWSLLTIRLKTRPTRLGGDGPAYFREYSGIDGHHCFSFFPYSINIWNHLPLSIRTAVKTRTWIFILLRSNNSISLLCDMTRELCRNVVYLTVQYFYLYILCTSG